MDSDVAIPAPIPLLYLCEYFSSGQCYASARSFSFGRHSLVLEGLGGFQREGHRNHVLFLRISHAIEPVLTKHHIGKIVPGAERELMEEVDAKTRSEQRGEDLAERMVPPVRDGVFHLRTFIRIGTLPFLSYGLVGEVGVDHLEL